MLALLCLGGVGIVFVLYDQATRPDRSAPDVVVDNYLRAYLVERNDIQASLYACPETGGLGPLAALREEAIQREREFNVMVRVSWGALTRQQAKAGEELVRADLTIMGVANGQPRSKRIESWEFTVADNDGWRVCAARRLS
jgi:hypothetical protein